MKTLLVALLAGFVLVVPAGGAAQAKTCTAPAYPATDGAFNPEVTAKHLSCAKAEKVMLKHYQCRTEAGPEGRCVHRINKGYACLEERYSDFYAPDYQATVTCKRNNKKVVFGYSQTKYDS